MSLQALALRPEQRLQHERRAIDGPRVRRSRRRPRGSTPRRSSGVGRSGPGEQQARHRLVDAALDGGRRVPDHDAGRDQGMEHAEPQRGGLEGAARDGAQQHAVWKVARRSPARAGARQRPVTIAYFREGEQDRLDAAPPEGAAQRGRDAIRHSRPQGRCEAPSAHPSGMSAAHANDGVRKGCRQDARAGRRDSCGRSRAP